ERRSLADAGAWAWYCFVTLGRLLVSSLAVLSLALSVQAESYVIESVSWEIEGRTQEYYLAKAAGIEAGKVFGTREALDAYLADKLQVLTNERVLESVVIDTTIAESLAGAGSPLPVSLAIRAKDTMNIVVLPYLKYDSNVGLLFAGRGRDYDFLGTTEALYANFNWQFDEKWKNAPGFDASFSAPFPLGGREMLLGASGGIVLPENKPVGINLAASVGYRLPVGIVTLEVNGIQSFFSGQLDSSDLPYTDAWYLASTAGMSATLPLWELPVLGILDLRSALSLSGNWKPGGLSDGRIDNGPALESSVSIAAGRIDWVGNFRKGLSTSAAASLYLNLEGKRIRKLSATVSAYDAIDELGYSARLSGFASFGYLFNAGEYVRGVMNNRIVSDTAFFVNLDLSLSALRIKFSDWMAMPSLRVFDFEQHWSPFLDFGIDHDRKSGRWFDIRDSWFGGGIEVITFPTAMRSFYLRLSAGWDLRDVYALHSLLGFSPRDGRSTKEFFFGMGHFY
ncbi:MAG: hypothetical protein ACOYM2_21235, partial [Rectinemataceae bacterium]